MLLMLAMLFTALPIAAFAEDEPGAPAVEEKKESALPEEKPEEAEKEQLEETEGSAKLLEAKSPATGAVDKVIVRWKTMQGRTSYNPADEGKEVIVPVFLIAEGLNTKTNKRETFAFYYDQYGNVGKYPKLKVGTDVEFNVPTDKLELGDGRVYTDVEVKDTDILLYQPNRKYGLGFHNPKDVILQQNMDFGVNVKLASDHEIILDSDKEDMKVRYYAEQLNKATNKRKAVITKGGAKVSVNIPFKVGGLNLGAVDYREAWSFSRAVSGSDLELYNDKVKSETFYLGAEWAEGDRQADLKKRYDLTVEGDDLTGWTLTLKSKIKEKKVKKASEVIHFQTEEIPDSSLPEGKREVTQKGVNGTKITYAVSYVVVANGIEETVKDLGEKIEVTEPVKEIVHVGTKKATPSTPSVPSKDVNIIFDANEGAWANGDTRRVYPCAVGSTITIESAPIREGYKFLYWKGSKYYPGESYRVEGGHVFTAMWEKDEQKPEEKPSVDSKIKTPRGSALTAEEIAKILAGMKKAVPAIPRAGVGR